MSMTNENSTRPELKDINAWDMIMSEENRLAELNKLVRQAYHNSKEYIPFVLDGAFAKHGNVSGADGSRFIQPGYFTEQGGVEHYLFADLPGSKAWEEVSREGGILIVDAGISEGAAVMAAADLGTIPCSQQVKVSKTDGGHPTLVTMGRPVATDVVTAIILLDGGDDPDLAFLNGQEKGKPFLVTWHPGPALPPSRPEGCEPGDVMSAAEAYTKGWRTVCFTPKI